MDESDHSKLKRQISKTIASTDERSVPVLVALILETEADLVEALTPQWQQEAVARLIRSQLQQIKIPDSGQLSFPFHDLSVRIPLKEGSMELGKATMGKLRECERVLRKRQEKPRSNSLLAKIRRQIELMEPYVHASRRLTVEQVIELRTKGIKPTKVGQDMSEVMKRYWSSKTAEERSAIAHRRRKRQRKLF